MNQEQLYFNGVRADTGRYARPPMSARQFAARIRSQHLQPSLRPKGVMARIDGSNPREAGWGLVVPDSLDPTVHDALQMLIRHRSNPFFRCLTYLSGESAISFQARHGASPGPVDPSKLPYYLLLVGSAEEIPFDFQAGLDVQYCVGRLDLADAAAVEHYASDLIRAETIGSRQHRMALFGARNGEDPATHLSSKYLVKPLAHRCAERQRDWKVLHFAGAEATKAALLSELRGSERPALIFTASHAVTYPPEQVSRQRQFQGALLLSDWPGPQLDQQPIPPQHFFSADDLDATVDVSGLIAFHFACFSGGTPYRDSFARYSEASPLTAAPFTAQLPRAMLSHRSGSALAVIAHVDRAWDTSFRWSGEAPQVAVFESALLTILDGQPVGRAMEVFGQRYAELAVQLHIERMTPDKKRNRFADDELVIRLWTALQDAQGYVLLGDPAARLVVSRRIREENSA